MKKSNGKSNQEKFSDTRIGKIDPSELAEQIDDLDNDIEKIGERAKGLEERMNRREIRIVETLGIFIALFTFISVEFQILRSFGSWEAAIALSLILLGALMFFLIILENIIREWESRKLLKSSLFWISILIITAGIFIFSFADRVLIEDKADFINFQKDTKNEIREEVEASIKSDINSLLGEADRQGDVFECFQARQGFYFNCLSELEK